MFNNNLKRMQGLEERINLLEAKIAQAENYVNRKFKYMYKSLDALHKYLNVQEIDINEIRLVKSELNKEQK